MLRYVSECSLLLWLILLYPVPTNKTQLLHVYHPILQLLLARGAPLFVRNVAGQTPCGVAWESKQLIIAKLLESKMVFTVSWEKKAGGEKEELNSLPHSSNTLPHAHTHVHTHKQPYHFCNFACTLYIIEKLGVGNLHLA